MNTQAFILTCKPGSQFHWGKPPIDDETALDTVSQSLHSDTLFAALADLAARTDAALLQSLKQWSDQGALCLSSAFVALQFPNVRERLFFLPKPATLYVQADKRRRNIEFVSTGVWEQGIKPDQWDRECVVLQHKYVALKSEVPTELHERAPDLSVLDMATYPKVAVHKISKEDSIYFQTNILTPRHGYFQTHFYFLLRHNPELINSADYRRLMQLIGLLAQEGLGGERSTGCGAFQQVHTSPFAIRSSGPNEALLSLYYPFDRTELAQCLFYRTVIRGGRRITGGSLDRVKMIEEGAILSQPVRGKIVELQAAQADHPYWRSGIAFSLPIHHNFATTDI